MDLDKEELEVTKNKNEIKKAKKYLKELEEIKTIDSTGIITRLINEIKEYIESKEK